jgi:hypothetical protein
LILACEGNLKRAEELADEVYALCGKPDKAIHELKRATEVGLPNHRAFENDAHLRPIRHPDFLSLMRDLRRDHEQLRHELDISTPSAQLPR